MRSHWWAYRHWPIRLRLTVWYMLLFDVVLLLFSGYLHLRVERGLEAQVDRGLRLAATQVVAATDRAGDRPALQATPDAQALLQQLQGAGYGVRLTAADGATVARFGALPTAPLPPPAAGYTTLAQGEDTWRVFAARLPAPPGTPPGWLQVTQSLAPVQQLSEDLSNQVLFAAPAVVFLAGLGGVFLADRALRPIDRLTRTAQQLGARDLSRRTGYRGPPDEVGRLATTFDQMLARLEAAFARERRFTADAAHELRTPLAALKGQLGVALSRPRAAAAYAAVLRDLDAQVDRLIRLSTDLLFLARLEQGRAPIPPERVDLSALLETIVDHVRPLAAERALALEAAIPAGLAVTGQVDHLSRLFLNLLDNALKYTPAGGRVAVRGCVAGASARVTVSDTGPGIAAAHLPHLFDRFYRAEADRSRAAGGAGLGLAMAAELARAHGGALAVASTVGAGSAFTVSLPLASPAPAAAPDPRQP